jgi:hypothetical protein
MLNELFSEATLIKQLNVEDALADGSYPASGSFINVSDYERFAFLVCVGASALGGEFSVKVQQATAANGALKDVTGATRTIAVSGQDKWYLIEVDTRALDINGDYHFVTLTASATVDETVGEHEPPDETEVNYAAILFFGVTPGQKPAPQGSDKGNVVVVAG